MNILFLISCLCDIFVLTIVVILFSTTLIMLEKLREMTQENNEEIHNNTKKILAWEDGGKYDEL